MDWRCPSGGSLLTEGEGCSMQMGSGSSDESSFSAYKVTLAMRSSLIPPTPLHDSKKYQHISPERRIGRARRGRQACCRGEGGRADEATQIRGSPVSPVGCLGKWRHIVGASRVGEASMAPETASVRADFEVAADCGILGADALKG
jgi:hypothetical protein